MVCQADERLLTTETLAKLAGRVSVRRVNRVLSDPVIKVVAAVIRGNLRDIGVRVLTLDARYLYRKVLADLSQTIGKMHLRAPAYRLISMPLSA